MCDEANFRNKPSFVNVGPVERTISGGVDLLRLAHPARNPPPALDQIARVQCNQLTRRHQKQLVNLLQRLVFRLGHEEQLVKEAERGQPAEETDRQAGVGHGLLHTLEVVCHDE